MMFKNTGVFLSTVVFCFLVAQALAQQCSTASMVLTGSTFDMPCSASDPPQTVRTITASRTYRDSCSGPSGQYATFSSTVTGYGQCFSIGGNWTECGPVFDPHFTTATSPTDYNRFYNQVFDTQFFGCTQTGSWRQDFKQCQGVACPAPPPPCTGCGSCRGCQPPGCSSPIVVDLLDEGLHLTSLENGVSFDFNGNGKPLFMSWTDPGYHNAWLALDRNGNGSIDSVQELFGFPTEPQIASRDGKRNGWLALAIYDDPSYGGNGDEVIDANDSVFASLRLWIDENHDAVSQSQELHLMEEMGVTAIELKYKANKSYKDAYGNTFQFEGVVNVVSQDQPPVQRKREAWDVLLNASDTSPNGIQPNVVCSLTPKHPPTWDLGLDADEAASGGVFTLPNLVCALTTKQNSSQ